LIEDERGGKFLGKTVQLVPHLTRAIQETIETAGKGSDVHIVELGGTVGDYEGLGFVEAMREFASKHPGDVAILHVVYVPYLKASKEFKTKPAQNAIKDLRGFGISPDIIVARERKIQTTRSRVRSVYLVAYQKIELWFSRTLTLCLGYPSL
jgi:CTP synthase